MLRRPPVPYGTDRRGIRIRFHYKGECIRNWSIYNSPLRWQVIAYCISLIGHLREGYDMVSHTQKRKIEVGGCRNSYLGHTMWSNQRGRRGINGQGSQSGTIYGHYNSNGQGHGSGDHGGKNVIQDGFYSRNGGVCGGQWYPTNPTHPQYRN